MATTCGLSVIKNSDGSYLIRSSDATNGVGFVALANSQDLYNNNLNSVALAGWNEILRQIVQITTIG